MIFQKESSNINISMEFSNKSTWMETTDNFIGFLHACGYVFDPADVADYIMEQYDVTSGIIFDTIDPRDFEGFDRNGFPAGGPFSGPLSGCNCGGKCHK